IFELPHVLHLTLKNIKEINESCSRDIFDFLGSPLWNEILKNYTDNIVIPIFLFFDDFEINNPLGSHAGIHKLGAAYISIAGIPIKYEAALLSLMQNSEIQAYLLFLEYILDAFNASFQTEETKVHLLQSAAENLLKTVLKNVIKASLLNFVSMRTINPLLACNRLSPDQIMVAEACQDLLDRLNQEVQGEIVKSVYDNRLAFYDIAAKEIRNKLFVKDKFLSKLRIFEPILALQQEDLLLAPQEEQDKVEKSPSEDVKKLDETKAITQTQFMVLPSESSDVTQIYVLVKIDKQGQIQLLDNNGPIGRNYTESGQYENLT
ncbi:hypothetical protein ALC57_14629, partial [Trachymyrmex cornetzi]